MVGVSLATCMLPKLIINESLMKISLIVAMTPSRVIGINNQLPWHLSADLKRFKQLTLGHPILMGRKTYESIGRPLPGRTNLVVTRNPCYSAPGCLVFTSIAAALAHCVNEAEVFVIGGASFYSHLLPQADYLYITAIHQEFAGDTYFPAFAAEHWTEIAREDITNDTSVNFNYSFIKLARKS